MGWLFEPWIDWFEYSCQYLQSPNNFISISRAHVQLLQAKVDYCGGWQPAISFTCEKVSLICVDFAQNLHTVRPTSCDLWEYYATAKYWRGGYTGIGNTSVHNIIGEMHRHAWSSSKSLLRMPVVARRQHEAPPSVVATPVSSRLFFPLLLVSERLLFL